jgi:ABC-2 type transport system permease protein
MAFVLPTVIFSIFAAIFSGATGDRIRIHLGLADFAHTAATGRLMDALAADPSLRVTRLPATDLEAVAQAVRSGEVDVALALRGDLIATPAGDAPGPVDQPVVLVENPARRTRPRSPSASCSGC